jgi:hypothetical protein
MRRGTRSVRVFAGCFLIPLVAATAGSRVAGNQAAVPRPAAGFSAAATIATYCVTCHNQRLQTGGLALDLLDPDAVPAATETWERVVRKLRLGAMPPHGMARPDAATTARLIAVLEAALDRPRQGAPSPGRPLLRRLNRAEYGNAIRDVLGIEVDVAALLPPDDAASGFDNVADAQGNSPALLQAYLAAARRISALAVGADAVAIDSATYTARQDLSQDRHIDGLPLGTVGGLLARHTFPADGDYEILVKLYRTNLNAIRGLEEPHSLELMLDGDRLLLASFGGPEDLQAVQRNPTDASDALEAARLRTRVTVTAGRREVGAAFLDFTSPHLETHRLQRFVRDFSPYDAEGAPHVQSITIRGPLASAPATASAFAKVTAADTADQPVAGRGLSRVLAACDPPRVPDEPACARRTIASLARRAYRRTPSNAELDTLLTVYREARAGTSFRVAMSMVLRRMLAGPAFVFRAEAQPAGVAAGRAYRVADEDLASRLSFFLWSSVPDEALLDLAAAGRLSEPRTWDAQVRRMLAAPQAQALVDNFAGQWLHLRNIPGKVPDPDTFPDFDDNLRQALRRELELFFASVVREDRGILDLLTANDTFLNERLARHYGIRGVAGSHFRRVRVADDVRRGILGKGGFLLVTSHANTTSPVLRGKWVLENLLGSPPPPPPPDVPALSEGEADDRPRSVREQLERHRASPACASCHRQMDPIGFALENFDAVGTWRTTTATGAPLDVADVLLDGRRVDGVNALRAALVERREVFVQTFTEKLLIYALGRGLTADDMPTVRAIVRAAAADDYRFSAIVRGIVNSVPFRMRTAS